MVLLIVAASIAVIVVLLVVAHRRAARESDLGWVTERWLSEYRADQAADSR